MALDAVFERFVHHSPLPVMARLLMQRALSPEWPDTLFEQHRQRQYTRELLFSTEVDLMALVALGLRPSLHAAAQATDALKVSLQVLYEKVNHTEPQVVRELVQGCAARLIPNWMKGRPGGWENERLVACLMPTGHVAAYSVPLVGGAFIWGGKVYR